MPIQLHAKDDVKQVLALLHQRVVEKDDDVMKVLEQEKANIDSTLGDPRQYLIDELSAAMKIVDREGVTEGEFYHSRAPLAGLVQAHLNQSANEVTHGDAGDVLPAVVDVFGEGNPIVWAPVLVNILVDHLKAKAPFQTATDKSNVQIPDKCSIALLGDWGADNDHAQRIAEIVGNRNVDIVIHLGDIYYAGNQFECERFLENWPLKIRPGNSFALNGNHEMYSRGIPYFKTVLPAFGQEASYFTLYNSNFQIHGLDTAYVPFSIDGSVPPPDMTGFWQTLKTKLLPWTKDNWEKKEDGRLQVQWDWVSSKLKASDGRKNILLSHNQPVSAYLPEHEAGHPLYLQFLKLIQPINTNAVLAWFFGHEHKATIYKDGDSLDFKARLIGNGAIPHSRQILVPPAKDDTNTSCPAILTMNDRALSKDLLGIGELDLAVSMFALLTLDGNDAFVEYINEDGSLFLKEKLTGGPNDVFEWGKDCGPLS